MHLGQFHTLVTTLAFEYQETQIPQNITALIAALNAVVASPSNPDVALAFKVQLDKCKTDFTSSSLNRPRPITKMMLDSIDGAKYVGDQLFSRMMKALSINQAAPALALQELTKLQTEVTEFYVHIDSLNNGMTKLKVEIDTLDEGEAEIGLLLPRDESSSTLKTFSKEANQWHNALSGIAELFDENAPELTIRTCSTTDWMIYLTATPAILAGLSLSLKEVNRIIRELIETRSLLDQLMQKKVSPDAVKQMQVETDGKLSDDIRALAQRLIKENYKGADEGRKNELENKIAQSLYVIADKTCSGAKIELRLNPPVTNTAEDSDQQNSTGGTQDPAEIERLSDLSQTLDNEIDLICFSEPVSVSLFLPLEDEGGSPESASAP